MKKLFTILCAGLFTMGISAQTDQGVFMLGGSTGLNYTGLTLNDYEPGGLDDDTESGSAFELEVLGGYFFTDGLMGGLAVSYKSEGNKTEYSAANGGGTDEFTQSTMMIAPTLRYYIAESGVWAQVQYGFGSTTDEYKSGSTTNSQEGKLSNIAIGAGYAIYLGDVVSLNPEIKYNMTTQTIEDGDYDLNTGNVVDAVYKLGGISFVLGIAIHLEN